MSARIVLIGAALMSSALVSAAAESPKLEEIIVTADPLGEVDSHTARPVRILDETDLRDRELRNIGEAVSGELGVSSSDFGPGVGRPVIRGLSGGRVRVLHNGIGSMDASSVSPDHAVSAEPSSARQIEIFRGPATLLYGSGASGGLVNIVSDRILDSIPEAPEGSLSVQYDSVSDGVTGAGSLNAGAGSFALHLEGMARDTGNYVIPGFADVDPDRDESPAGTLPNSDSKTDNLNLGASWVGARAMAGFSAGRRASNYGIPGGHGHGDEEDHEGGHEEESHGEEEAGGVRIDMQQARYDWRASLDNPLAGLQQIETRWGYNDYEHDEVEPDGTVGTRFINKEWEGRLEAVHEAVGSWNGVVGLQYRNKDFTAIGEEAFVPASTLESIAIFALEKGDFGRWHFDLGLRYEDQTIDSITGVHAGHGAFSASAGTTWDYLDGYRLGLSLTRSERTPGIEELASFGPHLSTGTFEIGNAALGKETAGNIDLSWQKTAGRLRVTANLFYNRIADYIFLQENDRNDDGIADRVEEDFDGDPADILPADADNALLLVVHSQEDAEFWGLELEAVLRLLQASATTLDLRLWTDRVHAELDSGAHLPRITPRRAGLGLDFGRGPWQGSLDFTRIGKQDNTAPLEAPTDAYSMLDAYLGYTFGRDYLDLTVFVRGSNLLDEEARRHTSFLKDTAPLPGRSGILGLRVRF